MTTSPGKNLSPPKKKTKMQKTGLNALMSCDNQFEWFELKGFFVGGGYLIYRNDLWMAWLQGLRRIKWRTAANTVTPTIADIAGEITHEEAIFPTSFHETALHPRAAIATPIVPPTVSG